MLNTQINYQNVTSKLSKLLFNLQIFEMGITIF